MKHALIIGNFILGSAFAASVLNTWPSWKVIIPVAVMLLCAFNIVALRK